MITNFDLYLDLFKAFFTLSDLVFPPLITSKSSKMLILVFFRLLIIRVIFLNLSSLINSILCISKFLFLNFAKSLFELDENRKLLPPARSIK